MAALPLDRIDAAPTVGWQDMRQQLFGQQRQRAAESRLVRVLGEVHDRVTRATKTGLDTPKGRAKALGAIVEGSNQLLCWHRDELLAERTAGSWVEPLPDTAADLVRRVRAASPLFEGARAAGRTVDCGDVIESIAQLRGPESDLFFNEALEGTTLILAGAYHRITTDAPTAIAAEGLGDLWDALLADVRALAVPIAPAPEDAPEEVEQLPAPETVALIEEQVAALVASTVRTEEVTAEIPEADAAEHGEVAGDEVAQPPSTAYQIVTELTPILATRFARIQLVAC